MIQLEQSYVDRGFEAAAQFLGRAVDSVPELVTLRDLLQYFRAAELELVALGAKVIYLRDQGAATTSDYLVYEKRRQDLYNAHVRLRRSLMGVLARTPLAAQIPQPRLAPKVTPSYPASGASFGGFGNPPVAAAAGGGFVAAAVASAAANPGFWMLGALVLVIVVAGVIGLAIWGGVQLVENVRDGYVVSRYLEQDNAAMNERVRVYEDCLSQDGGTPEACARVAKDVAPPPQHRPLPSEDFPWGWLAFGVAIGAGGYYYWRTKRQGKPFLLGRRSDDPIF